MPANHLEYWDFDKESPIVCPDCDWTGRPGDHMETYEVLLDVTCPVCRRMLLIVAYPTLDQTRAAAAAGNPEAVAELASHEAKPSRAMP